MHALLNHWDRYVPEVGGFLNLRTDNVKRKMNSSRRKVPRPLRLNSNLKAFILCMPSIRINHSLTTFGHALEQLSEIWLVDFVPFLFDNAGHLIDVVTAVLVNLLDEVSS